MTRLILSLPLSAAQRARQTASIGWGRVDILAAVGSGRWGHRAYGANACETQVNKQQVQLIWNPADGGSVNILRNGVVIRTTPDDGKVNDKLRIMTGTFTYQVCETDSGDCSNEVDRHTFLKAWFAIRESS